MFLVSQGKRKADLVAVSFYVLNCMAKERCISYFICEKKIKLVGVFLVKSELFS